VPRLCRALAEQAITVDVLSVAEPGVEASVIEVNGYLAQSFRWDYAEVPVLGALRLSRGLVERLCSLVGAIDVVHNHGLWLMPNVHAGRIAAREGKPLIVTTRGMLSSASLKVSSMKKKAFWQLLQKKAFGEVACFHATSEAEVTDIRAFGLRAPVAVIPNGVDAPSLKCAVRRDNPATLLYLGRIHPHKGLLELVEAWSVIENSGRHWRLRIVGPDDGGFSDFLASRIKELGLKRATVEPAAYGEEKQLLYARASAAVLPSHNENFGLVVAEALAAGTPVIASTGTPWAGLAENGCGWWVDTNPATLASAIAQALSLPQQDLASMGAQGRKWVESTFSWGPIAESLAEVYGWVTGSMARPSSVHLD
jgi:glycosyltransferase involved in cell wall biosynthesis